MILIDNISLDKMPCKKENYPCVPGDPIYVCCPGFQCQERTIGSMKYDLCSPEKNRY